MGRSRCLGWLQDNSSFRVESVGGKLLSILFQVFCQPSLLVRVAAVCMVLAVVVVVDSAGRRKTCQNLSWAMRCASCGSPSQWPKKPRSIEVRCVQRKLCIGSGLVRVSLCVVLRRAVLLVFCHGTILFVVRRHLPLLVVSILLVCSCSGVSIRCFGSLFSRRCFGSLSLSPPTTSIILAYIDTGSFLSLQCHTASNRHV